MKFKLKAFLLLIVPCAGVLSLSAGIAEVSTTTRDGRTIIATALTPHIIRVDDLGAGQSVAPVQSVLPIEAQDNIAEVSADGTEMTTSGGITVRTASGVLNISGTTPGSSITDAGAYRNSEGLMQISLATTSTGSFYGAGERGHKLNLRGDTLEMYNRQNYGYTGHDPRIKQMNITMPLFLASDGFAIVFDDYAAARMILSNPIEYISESPKPITYYYVGGTETMAQLTEQLTELTGRQPLAPFWSLGYITSRYGYRTQAETEGVIDTLKTAGYPVDGIVLDLYWYGKEEDMGRLEWDSEQWPDPDGMLRRLTDKGVKTIAISQPYILRNGRGVDNYNEFKDKGLMVRDSTGGPQEVKIWVGEGGMFDVSNPDTRTWLTNRYKSLTDRGMGGWWGDLGEPEIHPESGIHHNGLSTRLYHNKYGNDWSSIISELYSEQYPDRRLMTLMRGGTTGLQRFSVFPWSTDVSRSWGGLEPQVRIMLNSGLSGLGYMGHDVGGFAVGEEPYQPELYVRWLQTGLFSPILRTHAQQFAEPYKYPQYEAIIEKLIKDRYRWLPYNYTLAYENAVHGWPLVRPLDFHTVGTGKYDDISDEFMWGSEVLVAPVMREGADSRLIVFPEGCKWIDFHNSAHKIDGGTTIGAYPAPMGMLPLFVKAGAFIPMADYPMENTGDYNPGKLTVRYYPMADVKSSYTLFDDNRLTPGTIEAGQYRLIHFEGDALQDEITITIHSEGSYEGAPAEVEMNFEVYCMSARPGTVKVNGKKASFEFERNDHILELPVTFVAGQTITIEIKR